MSCITHFAAATLITQIPDIFKQARPLIPATIIALGVALAALAPVFSDYATLLLVLGGVFTGIGNGWLDVIWSHFYGIMRPERVSAFIPLAFILAITLYFLVTGLNALSHTVAILVAMTLPFASGLLLKKNLRETSILFTKAEPHSFAPVTRSLWHVVIGAAIFSLVFGLMWQMASLHADSFSLVHQLALIGNVIGALFLLLLQNFWKRKINFDKIYRFALPFFLIGFMFLPFMRGTNIIWLNTIVSLGYFLYDMFVCYLIAEVAYDFKVDGGVVNGIIRGITIGSMAFGMFLGFILSTYVNMGFVQLIVISLSTLYLIAIAFLVVRNSGKPNIVLEELFYPTEASAEKVPADNGAAYDEALFDNMNVRLSLLAEQYHLSRRETEILEYFARGRSAVFISETLHVSENTVRSHLRHSYEKLGVHSRQEVISMIESTQTEK